MRAAVFHAPFDVRAGQVPDPQIVEAGDVVVSVTMSCVCGSDLWAYRGLADRGAGSRVGHEFIGRVSARGAAVQTVEVGDLVIVPFKWSDGSCTACVNGVHALCHRGGLWGSPGHDGAQGEAVRVPFADGTVVRVPAGVGRGLFPSLLALTDVMSTGQHAVVSAGVSEGDAVAVIGDGAVGLCAVIAARLAGASRIVIFSRHPERQQLALRFGATDVVASRGNDGVRELHRLLGPQGSDAAIECVGTDESLAMTLGSVRVGGRIGYVGVPQATTLSMRALFDSNVTIGGGVASARAYIPDLLSRVLSGEIEPGLVFDRALGLDDIGEAYSAMHERRAIKTLLEVA